MLLFLSFIFLRFYQLPLRANLGWDQADSAWAARGIIIDNPWRLEGVPIKGNAGMFMGPLYYYLIAPFYFFSNLDMIASPIFASTISVVSFIAFYYITKKLFGLKLALVATAIYTFSLPVISSDRLQAAFTLIPIMSYVVFYFLYKFITGYEKYIVYLAAIIGFGFHIHFTSLFYLLIVILTLPFFPRNRKSLVYILIALSVFFLFISPMIYSISVTQGSGSNGIVNYLQASYHGVHLQRFLQLTHDGLISFEIILQFTILRYLSLFILPLFIFVFYFTDTKKTLKERLLFIYLMILFFLIPWVAFSTYTGELTDYYFSHSRYLAIIAIAFLLMSVYRRKDVLSKLFTFSLLVFFVGYNIYLFFQITPGNYFSIKQSVEDAINSHQKVKFKDRDPFYYTYYISTHDGKR